MNQIKCKGCGSKELFEEDGYLICAYCKSQFALQADDLALRRSVIDVHSDIQNLLKKCETDPVNSRRYANLVLDQRRSLSMA